MSEFWERLSERERRLALGAAAAILLAISVTLTMRAVMHLGELNKTINRLEQDLLNYTAQEASGKSVDKAFAEVASQHSSSWSEAEIHNRLRQEIYRLALEDPDSTSEGSAKLVEIPTLRQGALKDSGAGYREYLLTIKVPATDIYSLLLFLIRLQASPQSLRIDGLEITRPPESQAIAATISVTRTVVEGSPTAGAAPAAPVAVSVAAWDGARIEDWHTESCDAAIVPEVGEFAAQGGNCLKVESTASEAAVYMTQELEMGETYEVGADATTTGPAALQVANDGDGKAFEGVLNFEQDGKTYRYRAAFTVPGERGGKLKVRVPLITLRAKGVQAFVDNVAITKSESQARAQ